MSVMRNVHSRGQARQIDKCPATGDQLIAVVSNKKGAQIGNISLCLYVGIPEAKARQMWSARRLLSSLRRKGEMANHIPAVGPKSIRSCSLFSRARVDPAFHFQLHLAECWTTSFITNTSNEIEKLLQGKSNTFVEITKTGNRSAKFGTGGEVLNRCSGLFLRGYPEPWPLGCTFLRRISFPRAALTRITNVGSRKSGSRVAE
ncbi:hypothetical protein F5144DRAFT_202069 [Chaetomium tenue]|uniref:Uncharacterized protein n=1 Tax=Chaetomium tenue TaxID=1854479 RepID=A0ACB7PFB2_9PEZI|nr:hypothetical protein F5144DRAFT_202069 [Chaetomium globosum]